MASSSSSLLRSQSIRDDPYDMPDDDEYLPNYEVATASSDTGSSSIVSQPQRNYYVVTPDSRPSSPAPSHTSAGTGRRLPSTPSEKYLFTYSVKAGRTPLLFVISVEQTGNDPRKFKFKLTMKTGPVERVIAPSTTMNVAVDPRTLDFRLFLYPGRTSSPSGCLWSYRVWLCTNRIEHRIFGDDELWVGQDPDFASVSGASFARLGLSDDRLVQCYQGMVGKAPVNYIARWKPMGGNVYSCSLEYEAGAIGTVLFDDLELTLECDPRHVTFLIYSVPVSSSIPPLANHRLRVWLRAPLPLSDTASGMSSFSGLSLNESHIYQRLWKNDSFKVGADLDYGEYGARFSWGVRVQPIRAVDINGSSGGGGFGGGHGMSRGPASPVLPRRQVSVTSTMSKRTVEY